MPADRPNRLFIHGAGRRGHMAWPNMSTDRSELFSFTPGSSIHEQTKTILQTCGTRRITLFAHSIGAVPATLAANNLNLAAIVLVEPAFYDIVRGDPAVERHISAVVEAQAQAADGNLPGCWAILRPLMFGGPFDEQRWDQERPVAEHWSRANVPWGHGIRSGMLAGVPTLVITGGWNDEYEAIAQVLVSDGAEHRVLAGAAHRPQDLPEFRTLLDEFERTQADAAARSPTR